MNGGSFIVGNGIIADGRGLFLENGALFVDEGRIQEIGLCDTIRKEGVPFYDVRGRIILPGLVNFHHHLYSFFAPGFSPAGRTDTFPDILENLWWRLDRSFNEEILYFSVLMGALDSLSYGVTTIFDHHASMSLDTGSLDIAAEAFQRAGARGVLCFETSDRAGNEAMKRHVEENISFREKHRKNAFLGGVFGLHANLTLSEETLEYIGETRPADMPVHVHCGEAPEDFAFCRKEGYRGPVDRLNSFGLLDGKSILVHCVHLDEDEYRILDEIRPAIVINPESNANNRVGNARRDDLPDHLLGTDGMSGDMISALRSYFLLGSGGAEPFGRMERMLLTLPYERVKSYLPVELGFHPGAPADIAVLDYVPLSPVEEKNLTGHLLFGAKGGKTFLTAVNGRILWHEGRFPEHDIETLRFEARRAAHSLAQRFRCD
jgi:cytosine/adenosine deaminase-related metal-dependent hydrolase